MASIVGARPKTRSLPEIIEEGDRDDLIAALRNLRPSSSLSMEVRLGAKEPHMVALVLARRLARGSSGALILYIIDLASIHKSERWSSLLMDFERAASEWRRTFDAVELPIVIVDEQMNVTRINRAARMLVGKHYAEIIGQPLGDLGSNEPWKSITELSADVRSTRSPAARQVKDAQSRTLDVLTMLFNADDVGDGRVIAIVWDVSALIDLQVRLDQQKTMATMGALVAGVAHEVRNPLFAISATVDAMESMASPDLKEYFEVLREEIDRMTALMQDLLAYGRPATPVFTETAVGWIIDAAIRSCAALAQRQRITVTKDVQEDVTISADRDRLCRAVQNLIDNALQHAPADSEIVVSSTIGKRSAGSGVVEIVVTDHGPGFAPDVIGRVFEPFFSRRRGGTGLGMSLVQQIVTEHGGEVFIRNANGGGGIVTIRLPMSR